MKEVTAFVFKSFQPLTTATSGNAATKRQTKPPARGFKRGFSRGFRPQELSRALDTGGCVRKYGCMLCSYYVSVCVQVPCAWQRARVCVFG